LLFSCGLPVNGFLCFLCLLYGSFHGKWGGLWLLNSLNGVLDDLGRENWEVASWVGGRVGPLILEAVTNIDL
jgi:hypothetical protein